MRDTTIRMEKGTLNLGESADLVPTNEFGPLDVVSIDHTADVTDESVTFENPTAAALDLTGWTVATGQGATYTFPSGTSIEPGDHLVLHSGRGTDTDEDLFWGAESAVWNDDGGELVVSDGTATPRLSVSYDDRGVIIYDSTTPPAKAESVTQTPEATSADTQDENGFPVELVGGGLAGIGLLYAAVRMRSNENDSESMPPSSGGG